MIALELVECEIYHRETCLLLIARTWWSNNKLKAVDVIRCNLFFFFFKSISVQYTNSCASPVIKWQHCQSLPVEWCIPLIFFLCSINLLSNHWSVAYILNSNVFAYKIRGSCESDEIVYHELAVWVSKSNTPSTCCGRGCSYRRHSMTASCQRVSSFPRAEETER